MLHITIPETELWDERNERFIAVKECELALEHSLVSISKWEAKWCKPYLAPDKKTFEETMDYIRCMTLTQNVKPEVYKCITAEQISQIFKYIDAPMTATKIVDLTPPKTSRRIITNEEIYYAMIAYGIPMECQKWHLNRLFMLIRVCEKKSEKPKKMSKAEVMRQYSSLNAARRKRYNSKG